jgi:hypothetical protein
VQLARMAVEITARETSGHEPRLPLGRPRRNCQMP